MTDDVFQDPEALKELAAHDRDGRRIGSVGQVYVDDWSRRPDWITVQTDLFDGEETFVPLEGAGYETGGVLRVAHTYEAVKDAPRINADQHLGLDQEQELYLHYGLTPPEGQPSGAPGVGDGRPPVPLAADDQGVEDQGVADRGVDDVREPAGEPEQDRPRLRRFTPVDEEGAAAAGSPVRAKGTDER